MNVLWLKVLSKALISLGLQQILGEPCIFTDYHGILLFFYVDDVVFILATPPRRGIDTETTRDLHFDNFSKLRFFLGVRVIRDKEDLIYLCQDSYIEKLVKDYNIDTAAKTPLTLLPLGNLETPTANVTARHDQREGSLTAKELDQESQKPVKAAYTSKAFTVGCI